MPRYVPLLGVLAAMAMRASLVASAPCQCTSSGAGHVQQCQGQTFDYAGQGLFRMFSTAEVELQCEYRSPADYNGTVSFLDSCRIKVRPRRPGRSSPGLRAPH